MGARNSVDPPPPRSSVPRALGLGAAGGLAFWAVNFLISLTPVGAMYRGGLSISYAPMLVESLLGGLVIGGFVAFGLLRYFDRIPGQGPIQKSVVLTLATLLVIEVAYVAIDLDQPVSYIVLGVGINGLRFLALGWVIGRLCGRYPERAAGRRRAVLRPTPAPP